MSIYERLCRVSGKIPPFSRVATGRDNRELEKAVIFIAPMIAVSVSEVYSCAYLLSLFTFIILSVSFLVIGLTPFIALPLVFVTAIIVYYIIISYPTSVMNRFRLTLSEESDLIFEQFILVFQSGGTIFDAIEMIADSKHPYLSKAFQKMMRDINEGTPPETCLSEFAKNQPSEDLRRYFTAILSALERKTELLDLLSGESFEADLALRQKNLELESRLLVVSALTTYVPIILTLALSLGGYATEPIVILLAPFFIAITAFTRTRFTTQFSAYFDRPREGGIIAPSQKDIIAEYDEFLNLLMALGERLRSGDTLEVALEGIRDDMAPEMQRLIDPAIRAIYTEEKSLKDAFAVASNLALGERVSSMFEMIVLMCEASAMEAGERIVKIAGRLIKRSAVAKERDSIIAAQRLKIYLLVITSSVVLGLMASLAPFLYIGELMTGGPVWDPSSVTIFELLPLLSMLFLTTISNGYQNTKMVGGKRAVLMGILCGFLFWATFVMAGSIVGVVPE